MPCRVLALAKNTLWACATWAHNYRIAVGLLALGQFVFASAPWIDYFVTYESWWLTHPTSAHAHARAHTCRRLWNNTIDRKSHRGLCMTRIPSRADHTIVIFTFVFTCINWFYHHPCPWIYRFLVYFVIDDCFFAWFMHINVYSPQHVGLYDCDLMRLGAQFLHDHIWARFLRLSNLIAWTPMFGIFINFLPISVKKSC